MFRSIRNKYLGYNAATKLYSYEYELIDSDFGKVVVVGVEIAGSTIADGGTVAAGSVVIQEYNKRKLNVAANLIRCFKYHEKEYGWSIAEQIAWTEVYQPLFTPKLKADLQKYLTL